MISGFDKSNAHRATVSDVARLAGVSVATVVRVVNAADNVSNERRTKVLDAVSQLQYCPYVYAAEQGRANRNIRRQRSVHAPSSGRNKGPNQAAPR